MLEIYIYYKQKEGKVQFETDDTNQRVFPELFQNIFEDINRNY